MSGCFAYCLLVCLVVGCQVAFCYLVNVCLVLFFVCLFVWWLARGLLLFIVLFGFIDLVTSLFCLFAYAWKDGWHCCGVCLVFILLFIFCLYVCSVSVTSAL